MWILYVLSESSNVGIESTSLLPLGYSDEVICRLRDSDACLLYFVIQSKTLRGFRV